MIYNLNADNTVFLTAAGIARLNEYNTTGIPVVLYQALFGIKSELQGIVIGNPNNAGPLFEDIAYSTINVQPISIAPHLMLVRVIIPQDVAFTFGTINLYSNDALIGYMVYPQQYNKIADGGPRSIELLIEFDNISSKLSNIGRPIISAFDIEELPDNPNLLTSSLAYAVSTGSGFVLAYLRNGVWTTRSVPFSWPPVAPTSPGTNPVYYSDTSIPPQDRFSSGMSVGRSAYGPQVRATYGLEEAGLYNDFRGFAFIEDGKIVFKDIPKATTEQYGVVRLANSSGGGDVKDDDVITVKNASKYVTVTRATLEEITTGEAFPNAPITTETFKTAAAVGFQFPFKITINTVTTALNILNAGTGLSLDVTGRSKFLAAGANDAVIIESDTGFALRTVGSVEVSVNKPQPGLIVENPGGYAVLSSDPIHINVNRAAAALLINNASASGTGLIVNSRAFVNSATATAALTVTNSSSGLGLRADAPIGVFNGAVSNPAIQFVNDSDTGIYYGGTNTISFSAGGIDALVISSTETTIKQNLTVDGNMLVKGNTVTVDVQELKIEDPIITINNGETGSGVTVGFAGIEVNRGTLTNSQLVWSESNKYWTVLGDFNAIGDISLTSVNVLLNDGVVGTPGMRFSQDLDTGIYRPASNTIGFSVGGVNRFTLAPTYLRFAAALGDFYTYGNQIQSVAASGQPSYFVGRSAQGQPATFEMQNSDALSRWRIGKNATTEFGSNTGSNFIIERFADDGTSLGIALSINRETGAVNIPGLSVSGSSIGYVIQTTAPVTSVVGYIWKNSDVVTVDGVPAGMTGIWNGTGWNILEDTFGISRVSGGENLTKTFAGTNAFNLYSDYLEKLSSTGSFYTDGQTAIVTSTANDAKLIARAASGKTSTVNLQNDAGLERWVIGKNNTAESGSNAGSNFTISRYNDAGTLIATALTINRANGNIDLDNGLYIGSSGTPGFVQIRANAAATGLVKISTVAGLARWDFGKTSTAESGSDAGSNFVISRYSDAGTLLGDALTINRATGQVLIPNLLISVPTYVEQATAPTAPNTGYLWKNTSASTVAGILAGTTGIWNGSAWSAIGGGGGTTLPSYTSNALKFLRINSGGTDIEWFDINIAAKANIASPTFTGKVTTAASATGGAGLNIPPGAAPTSPVNGDFWSTTAGFYARVNGSTVGPFGGTSLTAASNSNVWSASSGFYISPDVALASQAPVVLTTGSSSLTPNMSNGRVFTVAMTIDATLGNPTNMAPGMTGAFIITQDSTGNRTLNYGTTWKFPSGAPMLSTAPNSIDLITWYAVSSTLCLCTLTRNYIS